MLTLHRLSLGYRILYTGVLVFMTAGTVVHTVHQYLRVGVWPGDVAAWYLGNEEDLEATLLLFPRSFEEVLGDAWMAVTTYTLAFVVFAAILARSGARPAVKAGLLVGYGAGALALAAVPALVRYGSAAFAPLGTAALLGMPLLALAITAVCTWDMWARRAAGPRVDPAHAV